MRGLFLSAGKSIRDDDIDEFIEDNDVDESIKDDDVDDFLEDNDDNDESLDGVDDGVDMVSVKRNTSEREESSKP